MTDKLKQIGNSFMFVSPGAGHRILDAFGDVKKYIPSAGEPTDDTTGEPTSWVNTETGTNTWVNSATAGEDFLITTGGTEYNGYSAQLKGEQFKVKAGCPFSISADIKLSNATQTDFLFGLAETDTTLTAADTAHALGVGGDGLFFFKLDGSTTCTAYVYDGGASVGSAALPDALDTAYHTYDIASEDGKTVQFYFDGAKVASFENAVMPDGDLTLSFSYRAGDGNARTANIKNLKAIQVFI